MVSLKSSIGEISSKISCSPDFDGHVVAGLAAALDLGLPGLAADQPVEAGGLEREELRELEGLGDLGEGDAVGLAGGTCGGARGQEVSFSRVALVRAPSTTHSATGQAEAHLKKGANVKSTSDTRARHNIGVKTASATLR